ncbi:MAG: Gfo/Idh/MocA family oxidoreductase [Planctomycetes bacterium]|nr:Gfo/Idh/MocA family oxidoreductase [Planctomycetota bacterium]
MSTPLRIGMIGLDTSHVVAFTKLLNDPKNEAHVPGGKVTVAFPGGSPDFDLSINRVEGFTKELRENWGVKIVDSPEAVASESDLILLESVDGRVHLDQFRKIVGAKKPVFIDKPLTNSVSEAREILRLTAEAGIAMTSCSSLRYCEELQKALAGGRESVTGIDVFGPMSEIVAMPGLWWYGIHSIEMMVAAMGVGCVEVRSFKNADVDLTTAVWKDGRGATFRGMRSGHGTFGATLHRKEGFTSINGNAGRPGYAGLLDMVMQNLPHGKSPIPADEMLEVVRIIEAANESRKTGGVVRL